MDYAGLTQAYLNNDLDWLRKNMVLTECKQLPIVGAAGELGDQDDVFIDICNWMFKNGLDVNAVENNGNTGLVVSCIKNNYDYAKMFIDNNADVNKKCQFGMTAIIVALNCEVDKKIIELLVNAGADLNEIIENEDGLFSTLEQAVYHYEIDMIEYLLKNGADIAKQKEVIETIEWDDVKDCEKKKKILENKLNDENDNKENSTNDKQDDTNNLDEKIYELLKKENKPLLISYIQKELKVKNKRDVTIALQTLNSQGIIYRSLEKGKALYSINASDGEARNPIQANINNMQGMLFNSMNQEIGILNDFDTGIDEDELIEIPKLNYSKNNEYSNDSYTFKIPDDFKVEKEDGRDFVAYLENPKHKDNSYLEGGAIITVYPGELIEIPDSGIKTKIPEVTMTLYDFTFWTAGYTMFKRYGGQPKYEQINLNLGPTGLISMKFGDCYNFYFVTCLKKQYKMMRIVIENVKGNQEQLKDVAISLMNNMVLKEEQENIIALDNPKYLGKKLDGKTFEEWIENAKSISENLKAYFNLNMKIASLRVEKLNSEGNFNIIEYKSYIRDLLKKIEKLVNKYLAMFKNYLSESKNTINENIEAFLILDDIISFFIKMNVNIEGDSITLENKYAEEIKKEFFDANIEKKLEPLKKEQEQENINEQRDKFEKNNKKEFEELEGNLKRQLSRLKRDADSQLSDFKDRLSYYDLSSRSQFNSAIRHSHELSNSYCDSLEDVALQINKVGKEFINLGATSEYKKKILEMLKEIKSYYWDIKYDFEHAVIYESGNFDYETDDYNSDEINDLTIEWQKIYNDDPEVIEKKERELKEKKEKEEIRQKNINTILERVKKCLVVETSAYSKESEEIANYIEKEQVSIEKEYDKEKNNELEKLEEESFEIKDNLKNQKKKLKKEIEDFKKEISSLSFLQFMKKSELEKNIEINEINIKKYDEKIVELENDLKNENDKISKKYENMINEKVSDLKNRVVFPANPNEVIDYVKKIISSNNSTTITSSLSEEHEEIMKEIKVTLSDLGKPATITEIQENNDRLSECSNQKISALLKQLVDRNEVAKTVYNKRSYFSLVNCSTVRTTKVNTLIDSEVDTLFSKQRNEIYKSLSKIVDEDVIEYLMKEYKDMSELRIYQVLYSLKDNGVNLYYIDNKISSNVEVK